MEGVFEMGVGCAEYPGRSRVLLVVAVEKQTTAAQETEPDRVALMERTLLAARLKTLTARIWVRLILIPKLSRTQTMFN